MFGKIFDQIYDSSVAEDWTVRVVFQDFIILADINGVVDRTPEAIARRTNVPLDVVKKAIDLLEKPDPRSRSKTEAGARIRRLDDHRDWGWQIINYCIYREVRSEIDRRRLSTTNGYVHYGGYVYFLCLVGDESKVKIGYSTNPWARATELSTGSPEGVLFIGCIKGGPDTETSWHERFRDSRLNGEWFTMTEALKNEIESVVDPSLRKVVTRSHRSDRSSKQKQKQKQRKMQKEVQQPPNPPNGGQAVGGGNEIKVENPAIRNASDLPHLKTAIGLHFKREEGDAWAYEEEYEFSELCSKRPDIEGEWAEILAFRMIATAQGSRVRESLVALLKGWRSDLDRARNYLPRENNNGARPEAKLRALDEQISSHPANRQSVFFKSDCSDEQRADLKNLRLKREELNAQIARS